MKKFLTLVLITLITPTIFAETMQGGSYTLNGSVDVIMNQGTGGSYTMNPNGDGAVGNSTGGTYTMYPTPYAPGGTAISPSAAAVIASVVSSVTYGTQSYPRGTIFGPIATTSSTYPVQNPNTENNTTSNDNIPTSSNVPNRNPIIPNPNGDGTSGYYDNEGGFVSEYTNTQYGYPTVSTSTNQNVKNRTPTDQSSQTEIAEKTISPIAKTFLWLLLLIIIIAILRRTWEKMKGR